mmetsp:Transcript_52412/g.162698  ORF Transcript_52412/g.162698 Transcript_52412/m.162698 type:complete len:225 (-) Transcript_52412:108-782(-)
MPAAGRAPRSPPGLPRPASPGEIVGAVGAEVELQVLGPHTDGHAAAEHHVPTATRAREMEEEADAAVEVGPRLQAHEPHAAAAEATRFGHLGRWHVHGHARRGHRGVAAGELELSLLDLGTHLVRDGGLVLASRLELHGVLELGLRLLQRPGSRLGLGLHVDAARPRPLAGLPGEFDLPRLPIRSLPRQAIKRMALKTPLRLEARPPFLRSLPRKAGLHLRGGG